MVSFLVTLALTFFSELEFFFDFSCEKEEIESKARTTKKTTRFIKYLNSLRSKLRLLSLVTSNKHLSLKNFLDEKVDTYNSLNFIENDPISIPHRFSSKEDIEISGFLSSTIAWGNRKSIINNANKMMLLFENEPYDFILNHTESDLKAIEHFVHRTFNLEDFLNFIYCLQKLYRDGNGLEGLFSNSTSHEVKIASFPTQFLSGEIPDRTRKHVAKISSNSAAKRLNMFLRWMVRNDDKGVDFGLWTEVNARDLFIPLDVHSGNSARRLGLISRKQNDWKSVKELTEVLRSFDPQDPAKYDFALFGMGVMEKPI